MSCIRMVFAAILASAVHLTLAAQVKNPPVRYVALGSSFASGPGLPTAALEPNAAACGRSNINYPHLLAQRRHLALTDVSCGGATTANILQTGQFGAPPQDVALTPDTGLVTVTIGGNDVFYLRTLGGLACQKQPHSLDEKPAPYCIPATPQVVDSAFAGLAQQMHLVAAAVHERAPASRLVFAGYLTILPSHGTCDVVQLSAEEADRVRMMADRLNTITAEVAHSEHADFMDTAALSHGHDACSSEPWTNGFTRPDTSGHFATIPFHPNAAGMTAVANALDELLSKPASK